MVGSILNNINEVAGLARLADLRPLLAMELARGTFCCLSVANTLFSLLPVPPELKQIVNFATCVANLAWLVASAAPFVPLVLGILSLLGALFSMNLGLGTGCGGKKKGGDGGGSGPAKQGRPPGQGGGPGPGRPSGGQPHAGRQP